MSDIESIAEATTSGGGKRKHMDSPLEREQPFDFDDCSEIAKQYSKLAKNCTKLISGLKESKVTKDKLYSSCQAMQDLFHNLLTKVIADKTVSLYAGAIETRLKHIETMNEQLVGKIDSQSAINNVGPSVGQSWATVVKANKVKTPSGKTITPEAKATIIIRPIDKDSDATADQIKEKLIKSINPRVMGLKLDKVTRAGKSAVRLESSDRSLSEKISSEVLAPLGLTQTTPGKLQPRLALHGVPSDLTLEEVKSAIVSQNFDIDESDTTKIAEINNNLSVLFKFGKRDRRSCSWVIGVNAQLRKSLLDKGRLYIGWDSCRIEDHIRVLRCYRCQKFGHLAAKCESTVQCGHCAEAHETKDCKDQDKDPKCCNCSRFGHKGEIIKHEASSIKCPTYQKRVAILVQNTEYGQIFNLNNGSS